MTNASQHFSILADEASDVSDREILCYSIRFVKEGECEPSEYFLDYQHVTDLSGEGLANAIVKVMVDSGLDMSYLVGQGYDGAAAMKGSIKGVQARIRNIYPKAIYTHCAAHSLNLALNSASVNAVSRTFDKVKEIGLFFDGSPCRKEKLLETIRASTDTNAQNHSHLITLCATRWIERQDAIQRFFVLFVHIYKTLRTIAVTANNNKADGLACLMEQLDFTFTLSLLNGIASDLIRISSNLQSRKTDLIQCCRKVASLRSRILNFQEKGSNFDQVYNDALAKLCEIVSMDGIPIERHGLSRRDYCKDVIFLPYLSDMDQQLGERFSSHQKQIYYLQYLIPCYFGPDDYKLIEAFRIYAALGEFDCTEQSFLDEYRLWKNRFCNDAMDKTLWPTNASEALQLCIKFGRNWFPSVFRLLKILVTLPVTSADVERGFSAMRRLKTSLRNTMSEERLNGLALLHIHKAIEVDVETVINNFARSNRRLNLQ